MAPQYQQDNKQQHRVANCYWTRAFDNFIENVDPGLIESKDEELKPSETQLPVSWKPSCQAQ